MNDEMKIGIYSKVTKGILSKIIKKAIKKKIGRSVDIQLSEVTADITDRNTLLIHVDGCLEIPMTEVHSLLESIEF